MRPWSHLCQLYFTGFLWTVHEKKAILGRSGGPGFDPLSSHIFFSGELCYSTKTANTIHTATNPKTRSLTQSTSSDVACMRCLAVPNFAETLYALRYGGEESGKNITENTARHTNVLSRNCSSPQPLVTLVSLLMLVRLKAPLSDLSGTLLRTLLQVHSC